MATQDLGGVVNLQKENNKETKTKQKWNRKMTRRMFPEEAKLWHLAANKCGTAYEFIDINSDLSFKKLLNFAGFIFCLCKLR